jgi:hypothetical protein
MIGMQENLDFGSGCHRAVVIKCLEKIEESVCLLYFWKGIVSLASDGYILDAIHRLVLSKSGRSPSYRCPDAEMLFSFISSKKLDVVRALEVRGVISVAIKYMNLHYDFSEIVESLSEVPFGYLIRICIQYYNDPEGYKQAISSGDLSDTALIFVVSVNLSVAPEIIASLCPRLFSNLSDLNTVLHALQKAGNVEQYLALIFSHPDYPSAVYPRALNMISTMPLNAFVQMLQHENLPLDTADAIVDALIARHVEEAMLQTVLERFTGAQLSESTLAKVINCALFSDAFVYWVITNFCKEIDLETVLSLIEQSMIERDSHRLMENIVE